jgi:hypothetical protein
LSSSWAWRRSEKRWPKKQQLREREVLYV